MADDDALEMDIGAELELLLFELCDDLLELLELEDGSKSGMVLLYSISKNQMFSLWQPTLKPPCICC